MILWQVMDDPSQTHAQLYEDDDLMLTSDRSDSTMTVPPVPSMHLAGSALRHCDWGAVMHAPGPDRLVHYRTQDCVLFLDHMSDTI